MGVFSGYRYIVILPLILGLSGCASKPERAACDERDWFELGRTDGARGTTNDQLPKHREDCSPKKGRSDWDTMYANGRNAGLVEYCSPDNAVELGKSGIAYMYVCPATMESEFLVGYRKGQRLRELELANRKIEAQIESVTSKLAAASEEEKTQLEDELKLLREQKTGNDSELKSKSQ